MTKKIIWSPASVNDFENILEYLSKEWDVSVANRFLDIIDSLLLHISINPRQYPAIHKNPTIRKCVVTKHSTLFYREKKDHIDLLRIYDTRQDQEKLKF